ncbi:hypothetical protein DFH08DRAFT_1044755 [Mycena albidolilacea]|uniref:Uncharacterized protein n=1 Tax=Mycena albidolilacea TaxID=1033008 RepID=A0AAD7EDB5_9AGAR|nr:hypothetical protein DFH08DRAFT_1044755 [Mycena albidolilacea]
MIATNALLEFAFFVTISSAALYAEYLGGSALFSGLTIGIPTVFSGLALIPLTRYDGDPRIIGIHRRTTLASWLVLGQAFGFSVFNGYTSPYVVYNGFLYDCEPVSQILFEDLPKPHRIFSSNSVELGAASALASAPPVAAEVPVEQYGIWQLSGQQWGVIISMCWSSMSCFFVLSRWDFNISIFTPAAFNHTPYAAGNFIALGGISRSCSQTQ